jgi:hypothetical protein
LDIKLVELGHLFLLEISNGLFGFSELLSDCTFTLLSTHAVLL